MNAIGDLARRFFGEGHQNDALRRKTAVGQQELEHLGDDRRGLAGAGAGFDDQIGSRGDSR